MLEHQLVKED